MGKRGDFFVLILLSAMLCCSAAVLGWQSDASINTASIYETNSADFMITVANAQDSKESINNISVATSGFTMNEVKSPSGWQNVADESNANLLDWNIFIPNGFNWIQYIPFINLGISSDATQNFRFNAKALKVDKDETYDWPVTSIFHDQTTDIKTVRITVLNDYTGPELSDWTPSDGAFIKKGTDDLPAGIDAVDPETGVSQVFFNYIDCAQASNASAKTSIELAKDVERYSSTADVSQYDDSINVCFSFIAENNGGALSNYSGRFTIDGIAPVVELLAPENNALMNALSEFIFISTDNLAPETYCTLYSDGVASAAVTAPRGENTTVNVSDMPEGNHTWSVSCDDMAGWTGKSNEERKYILDKTPPTITMVHPGNGAIVKPGTIVEISVADNILLKDVYYTLNLEGVVVNDTPIPAGPSITFDTADWEEGDNIIMVTATDAAGNIAKENLLVIIDRTAPAVNLTAPESGGSYDYHIQYVFNTTDNYDKIIDCVLYIDNEAAADERVNTSDSSYGVINFITKLGYHEWYVTCTDDAGWTGKSDTWNFTAIDTTGPDVTVNDMGTTVRGNPVILNATLYDISGIDTTSVYAEVTDLNGVVYNISLSPISDQNGDYIGVFTTTLASPVGEYPITVYAKDSNGNPNSAAGSFNVTYGYVVLMNLDHDTVDADQDVIVTGSVKKDDDSLVPENKIDLVLPDSTVQADIASTGGFTYVFSYGTGGLYNITAKITPENGFTFGDSKTLEIKGTSTTNNEVIVDTGKGFGAGIPTKCPINEVEEDGKCVPVNDKEYCGDGNNNNGENCETCPTDAGCGDGEYCDAGSCKKVEKCGNGACDSGETCEKDSCCNGNSADFNSDDSNCGSCGKQCGVDKICSDGKCIKKCDKDEDCGNGMRCNYGKCVGQQEGNNGFGAGATGFLNLSMFRLELFWWVVLMLLSIVFVLTYMKRRGLPGFRKEDELGLDDYLERRNQF